MDFLVEIKEIMKEHPGRLEHILGVLDEIIVLANIHGLDAEKARTMALLHDVAKKIGDCTMKTFMVQGGYDLSIHHKIWHAYVGEFLAFTKYGIKDDEILKAIKWHTTGHPDMTDLQKALFIADITEKRTRDFKDSALIREVSHTSLDEAIAIKLDHLMKNLFTKHQDTYNMWEKYKKYLREV